MVAPHLVLVLVYRRLCDVGVLIHNRPICLLQVWVVGLVFGNVSLAWTISSIGEGVEGNICVVCVAIL